MTPYQLKKQKKRTFVSFFSAFLLHAAVMGAFLLYDYFFIEDLSEFSGPVLVKLGEPEGLDIPVLPDEPEEAVVPAEETSPSVPENQQSEITESSVPEIKPDETEENPILPDSPVQSETDPSDAADPAGEDSPVSPEPEKPADPQPVIVSGEEAGNSYEYQFAAEEGVIGRSFGAEIFLYMPLPRVLTASLFNSISGVSYLINKSRQDLILEYYREIDGELYYDRTPPIDDIRAIWDYLIEAGYDFINADYKSGTYLRPVIITFTISASAELIDVKVQKSSGNPEVDAAVLEGFKNASFSNSGGREIKGRFTYRFE